MCHSQARILAETSNAAFTSFVQTAEVIEYSDAFASSTAASIVSTTASATTAPAPFQPLRRRVQGRYVPGPKLSLSQSLMPGLTSVTMCG